MPDMLKALVVFILSLIVVVGYTWGVFLVLNGRVDTAADPQKALMIGQALGNLQGMASVILSYYFGTTQGNKDKDKTVTEAISKLPVSPVTQTTVSATSTTGA